MYSQDFFYVNYPALAVRRESLKPRKSVQAIIVHTTGYGPHRRMRQGEYKTPFEAALHIYQHISSFCGHFLCDQEGRIEQIVPLDLAAWHVGSQGHRAYRWKRWKSKPPKYQWWFDYWNLESPYDFGIWGNNSCNANTIGIEVVPPLPSQGPWSEKALQQLQATINHLRFHFRENLPVYTHSDAHPLKRTTPKGNPWDPSRAVRDQLKTLGYLST